MRYFYLKTDNAVREYKKISASDSAEIGGSESFLYHFLRFVRNEKSLVISLHTDTNNDVKLVHGNLCIISYYRHFKNKYIPRYSLLNFICKIKLSFLIFINIVKFRPNMVLCWSSSIPYWFSFLAAKFVGSRFVLSKHTRFADSNDILLKNLLSKIDKFLIKFADAVIVHGPYLYHEVINLGVDSTKVINFDSTYPDDSSWVNFKNNFNYNTSITKHKLQILFIGRVEYFKGVFDLLKACNDILRKNDDIVLVYVGHGRDIINLENAINAQGLSKKAFIMGNVDHNKLPDIIRRSYCVVTPTKSKFPEGRCMVAMEAMVMGRPVIAPNFGPFLYIVEDNKNGLLYEVDNVYSLNEKINKLIYDRELYLNLVQGARETGLKLSANNKDYYQALVESNKI